MAEMTSVECEVEGGACSATLQYVAQRGRIAAREVTSTPDASTPDEQRGARASLVIWRRWMHESRDREQYAWARERAAYWAGYYAEASRIGKEGGVDADADR